MNHSVYVFGELGNGYTQYPDDYTKDFFKKLQKQTQAQTQLAIHRDGELMYYAYTRKLSESSSNNQYIGMCCVFNGVYTDKYKELFDVCEKAVTSLVVNGDLLEFTNSGEITSKVDKLYKAESHFKTFSEYLSLQIGVAFAAVQKLPPINYAISTEDVKRLKVDDSPSDISNAIRDYSTVIVSKNDGYNSASLTSYAGKLKTLNVEISSLKSQISSLKDINSKLEKEKKRTKLVTWLIIILVAIAFGLYLMWLQNTDQQKMISDLNDEVQMYDGWVERLQKDSVQLVKTEKALSDERLKSQRLSQEVDRLQSENYELDKELSKQKGIVSAQKETISQLEKKKTELESSVSNLRKQLNTGSSSYSSSTTFSSTSKYVGPSTDVKSNSYDKTYRLWLHANKSVKIQSFWVKADSRGPITIGLYNKNGSRIAQETFNINSTKIFKELSPSNFIIPSRGDYYLAIDGGDLKLSYHSSNSAEFRKYSKGNLQIIGINNGSNTSISTSHYQYFYNIKYID